MARATWEKDGVNWREMIDIWYKDGAVWKNRVISWIKVNGVWEKTMEYPPRFKAWGTTGTSLTITNRNISGEAGSNQVPYSYTQNTANEKDVTIHIKTPAGDPLGTDVKTVFKSGNVSGTITTSSPLEFDVLYTILITSDPF